MFCPNCGSEVREGGGFCTNCGAPLAANAQPRQEAPAPAAESFNSTAPVIQDPAQPVYAPPPIYTGSGLRGEPSRLKSIFGSTFFLVLCIVYSASLLLGLIGGSFDILGVLFCISLWITFGAGKSQQAYFKTSGLRFSRGVLTAEWILNWVAVGGIALLAITFLVGGFAFGSILDSGFDSYDFFDGLSFTASGPGAAIGVGVGIMLFFVFLIVIAILVVVNIFCYGGLRKFSASVISAAETGVPAYQKVSAAKIWLMIIGVIGCLSIFNIFTGAVLNRALYSVYELRQYAQILNMLTGAGVLGILGNVGKAVTAILASVMISRNFKA